MKRAVIGIALALTLLPQLSQAAEQYNDISDLGPIEEQEINSHDPCTVFICMSEKLYGQHSSECEPVISYFFSLKKFGRHGFDPWETFKKRRNALGKCPTADPAHVSKILSAFGRLRG